MDCQSLGPVWPISLPKPKLNPLQNGKAHRLAMSNSTSFFGPTKGKPEIPSTTPILHLGFCLLGGRYAKVRCCPLCRSQQYQKKRITDGAVAHRHACAVAIQAAARGFLARRRYVALRRHIPPADSRLKQRWVADQLQVNPKPQTLKSKTLNQTLTPKQKTLTHMTT